MAADDVSDDEFDVASAAESIRAASLDSIIQTITMDGYRMCDDFEAYLKRLRTRVIREIHRQLKQHEAIKVMLEIDAEYIKPQLVKQEGGALERARKLQQRRKYEAFEKDMNVANIGLCTKMRPITHVAQVPQTVEQMLEDLRQRHITKMQNGSGFMIRAIVKTVLKVAEHLPLRAGSYLPLPSFLANKKCIINIQNQDMRCFAYSLLASIKTLTAPNIRTVRRTTQSSTFSYTASISWSIR